MLDRSTIIYSYDGSFDGLLCCVFESYDQKEIPVDILPPDALQSMLFPVKYITTDEHKSKRVFRSIPEKMGAEAFNLVRFAFLTCLVQKELYILLFLRLGFLHGASVMNMLTNDTVNTLLKAVNHLKRESHLLLGFVRFSVFNNALVAQIEPKNRVLPLITQHFCQRYPKESFLIFDKTHSMALLYHPYQYKIVSVEDLRLPEPDDEELAYRDLWCLFYKSIEVEGRHNPKSRMSHMPKRYWSMMTEFCRMQNTKL